MPVHDRRGDDQDECTVPSHPIPAKEIAKYCVARDPHSERDIANYVEGQARDETVQNVEKIRRETVVGETYEMWDVTTEKDRWWVITNPTNLYSQRHFPSLDYTLSFHVGLMMRVRSQSDRVSSDEPTPFDEVFRRHEQAVNRHDTAVEAEDYQSVGMQLRESLISLVAALRRRVQLESDIKRPQDANFIEWSALLMERLCQGNSNKELRQYLKNTAREAWQLVSWLTHHRNANKTASSIAIHACDTLVGHFVQILQRERADRPEQCPVCKSRNIRTHFDIGIEPDGGYYMTCGVCDWSGPPADHLV